MIVFEIEPSLNGVVVVTGRFEVRSASPDAVAVNDDCADQAWCIGFLENRKNPLLEFRNRLSGSFVRVDDWRKK